MGNVFDFVNGNNLDIEEENREMRKKAQQKSYHQASRQRKIIAKLNNLRETTLYEALSPFYDEIKKIHSNTVLNTDLPQIPKIESKIKMISCDRVISCDSEGSHALCRRSEALEAQQELKEQIQFQSMRDGLLKAQNDFLSKNLLPTITALSQLLQKWTERLGILIEQKGDDFKSYSEEEKEFVRTGVTLAKVVSQFISETYITEKGYLKTRYKKIFLEAPTIKKGLLDSETKYIEYFDKKIRG